MSEMVVGALRIVTGIDNSDLDKGLKASAQASGHFKKAIGQDMADIERSMQRPELAMKRLEASLRGDRLLASANKLAEAMLNVGGKSRLTEAEQARANATFQKAIEKYKVLGVEAPKALLYMEAATRKHTAAVVDQTKAVDKMAEGMRRMGEMGRAGGLQENLRASERLLAGMASAGRKATAEAEAVQKASLDRMAQGWTNLGAIGRKAFEKGIVNDQVIAGMSSAGREAAALQAQLTKTSAAASFVNRGFSALTGTVGQMAVGFTAAHVAMRAVDTVVDIGRQAFATAGKLTDMSAATGLSTETLQRLDYVADQAGGSLEDFTNASFRLGVRLSSGSNSVNKAVEQLGLNLATLRKESPDRQLEMVTQALLRISNEQDRNRLGMELFGKTYSSIAAAVAQDMNKLGREASVMSNEQVKALDDAADAWGRFWKAVYTGSGKVIAAVLPPQAPAGPGRDRTRALDAMTAPERSEAWRRFDAGEDLDKVISDIKRTQAQLDARDRARAGTSGASGMAAPRDSAVEQLRRLDAELAKLTKTERDEIAALQALGKANGDIEDQFGLTEGALARLSQTQRDASKATKELAKDTKDAERQQAAFNAELSALAGTDAIEAAHRTVELLNAASKQGVQITQLSGKEQERVNAVLKEAIATYRRLGTQVPGEILMAFEASRAALGSVLDVSALTGLMPDASGQFVEPSSVGIGRDMDFARAAAAAYKGSGSPLDTSALKDVQFAADGALVPFRDLSEVVDDMILEFRALSNVGGRNPMEHWIANVDTLSRSFNAAGLSVSRYTDAAISGLQAGFMLRQQGLANQITGGAAAVGSMAAATGGGSRTDRIVGGAVSGAMTTAALTGTLAATGAKLGSWGGWMGMAGGAAIGAGIGFLRSRTVSKDEKEARAAFADWQRQVVANFDAIARQQGRVTTGMDDWAKMVEVVAGAYEATGRSVEDVHHDMMVLSNASQHSAEAVTEALEHINGIINEQAADVEILNGALSEYGFTLDELGEKQIGKTQTAEAKRLADQYRVLIDSGVDIAAVHERMGASVSKWLQDTMRTGAAIPSAMRPVLENFAKAGELVDANGVLMDQAAVGGLKFVDTWADGMDRLVVKLDKVLERFAELLGMPADTLSAAQGSIDAAAAPSATRVVNTPFGPVTIPVKHDGGYIEKAHGGTYVGARSLFGRAPASDERDFRLQVGEGVTNKRMTSMFGGRAWVDAVNAGNVPSAVSMMMGGARQVSDPFGPVLAAANLAMRNSFLGANVSPVVSSPIGLDKAGDTNHFHLNATVNINSTGDTAHDVDRIIDGLKTGLQTNRRGIRTTLIQKVGKGH